MQGLAYLHRWIASARPGMINWGSAVLNAVLDFSKQQIAFGWKSAWVSPAPPRSRRKRRSEFLVPYDGSGKLRRCLPFSTPFPWRPV